MDHLEQRALADPTPEDTEQPEEAACILQVGEVRSNSDQAEDIARFGVERCTSEPYCKRPQPVLRFQGPKRRSRERCCKVAARLRRMKKGELSSLE